MDWWAEGWRDMAKIFTLAFGIVIMAGSGIPPLCGSACRLQSSLERVISLTEKNTNVLSSCIALSWEAALNI